MVFSYQLGMGLDHDKGKTLLPSTLEHYTADQKSVFVVIRSLIRKYRCVKVCKKSYIVALTDT